MLNLQNVSPRWMVVVISNTDCIYRRVLHISRDLEKFDQSHLIQHFWKKDGHSDLIARTMNTLDNMKLDLLGSVLNSVRINSRTNFVRNR